MDNTGDILNSIVNDYENILSLAPEQFQEKILKIRESLLVIVKQHLTDTDKISIELKKVSLQSSQTHMVISFLNHLISHFPHPVFVPSTSQHNASAPDKKDTQFNSCIDFLYHLATTLLRLLSSENISMIHEDVERLYIVLHELIKTKNITIYSRMITQLVNLNMEICSFSEKYFDVNENVNSVETILLNSFSPNLNQTTDKSRNLVLSTYEQIEAMQTATTRLLNIFLCDVCQFAHLKVSKLISSVLTQIEVGFLPLKSESLDFMTKFTDFNCIDYETVDNFIPVLFSLIDLAVNGLSINQYTEAGFTEEEINKFSFAVEKYLSKLFEVKHCESAFGTKTRNALSHHFTKMLLGHLSSSLDSIVTNKCLIGSTLKICKHLLVFVLEGIARDGGVSSVILGQCNRISCWVARQDFASLVAANAHEMHLCLVFSLALSFFSGKQQTMTDFTLMFSSGCENILKESQTITHLKNSSKSGLVVLHLSTQLLVSVEALLHCFNIVSNVNNGEQLECCRDFGHRFLFDKMFINLFGEFVTLGSQLKSLQSDLNPLSKIYESLIHCANVVTLWLNATSLQIQKEQTALLEYSLMLFSLLWIEEHDWLDLKSPGNLKKPCVVSLSQALNSSGVTIDSKVANEQTITSLCLTGIALLPSHISPSWRVFVLTKWGLNQSDSNITVAALQRLPFICANADPGQSPSYILPVTSAFNTFLNLHKKGSLSQVIAECLTSLLTQFAQALSGNGLIKSTFYADLQDYYLQCGIYMKAIIFAQPGEVGILNENHLALFNAATQLLTIFSNRSNNSSTETVCRSTISGICSVLQHSCKLDKPSSNVLSLLDQLFAFLKLQAKVTDCSLEKIAAAENVTWNLAVFERLQDLFQYSIDKKELALQSNIIKLAGSFLWHFSQTKNWTDPLFSSTLIQICKLICVESSQVSSTAYLEIEKAVRESGEQNFMKVQRNLICECVIQVILNPLQNSRSPLTILDDLAHLSDSSIELFVSTNLPFLIPPIFVTIDSVASTTKNQLLSVLSQSIDKKTTDIIIQNFKHIFCYAVMKQADLNGLFENLEKETRIKKESMILLNYGSLIQHLLAAVSTDTDRICSALHYIHQIKSPDEKDVSISQLLNPHLLSVLTFFNGQFRISNIPLSEKKQICSSIICLLKLMGRNDVTSACVKTINTLCLAQQVLIDSPEALVCCQAWDQLVRSVDPVTLGSILSQVVVMLLPFLDKHSDQVAATMEFLVISNSKHTRANLGELYFVPEHESLAKVHGHIKRQLKRQQNEQNFLDKLELASKQITHENSVVREHALQRLREVLQQNQSALQRHHATTSGSGDLMRHLVSMLFSSCRDSNPSVRLLAVKCLGEIGAVAPDRLSTAPEPKGESPGSSGGGTVARFSFDDPEFAYELIRSVAQAFLAAKPKHQDISAFAVQELLKVYDCSEAGRDSPGRRLWRRFPEQLQTVLEPHLSSRYMLKISDINLSAMKRPILHRKQNMGFQEWIGTMCAVLMQMATSVADESSKVRRVAQACAAVVRNDINVALFLLPHLVLEVLRSDDQHTAFIIEEVMAVLESTYQIQEGKENSNPLPASSSATATLTPETCSQDDSKVTSLHGSPLSQLCAQAIFTVLDHVTRWLRQPATTSGGTLAKTRHSRERQIAKAFLAKVPQKSLAMTSLRCRAHSRALMHYEAYLRESCEGRCDSEAASFLQRVFVEMDETDGVAGVVAVRGVEPTPETQLKLLESTGALQDAAACYEQIISSDPDDLLHHKGFVKCLIDLGQSATAISVISGFQSAHKEWEKDFLPLHSEACWRLGQWDLLEARLGPDPVARTTAEDWGTAVGRTLLAVKNRDWDRCRNLVDNLYLGQTEALSAASMESASYQRGYDSILRLHAASDLERAIFDQSQGCNVDGVMSLWQLRFRLVQPSFRAKEPLLSLQRSLLGLLTDEDSPNLKRHLGKLWLQSSKLARKSSHLQTAFGALLSAQKFGLPEHCIEHAKWLWQKGESHQALLSLQRGVSEHFAAAAPTSGEQRKTRAKVMLLVAKLMEGSSSFDSNTVLKQYKEVVSYMGDWEDSHFHCAKYYDKLMTALLGENRGVGKAHHLYYIMHHYGLSLCYGNSHIYESLTKLLTVWFDYGANAAKLEKAGKPQSREDIQRVLDVIADLRKRLPAYVFFVAFSQLTSRICHQHGPTYVELKEILVKVIQAFPQRSLWSMLAISKSTFKQRAARCQEIFQRVSFKTLQVSKLINDATRLTNQLLELCNKPVTSVQPLSINQHFKGLKRTVEDPSFSRIMLPLQQFMAVTLPQKKGNNDPASQSPHDPFPEPVVHIVGFNDVVEVLPSLQRPKKVSMRASDGSSRLFLCKPKDDLRKDARLAEFAAIVNKCLKRDPESGRRELRIRTYAVIPLNEECGLIEWVNGCRPLRAILLALFRRHQTLVTNRELLGWATPKHAPLHKVRTQAVVPLNEECGLIEWVNNMKGLRHILLPIYKARDLYTSGKQLKAWQLPASATLQKKLDVFRNKLLPRHPPVFHEWFLSSFPDASAWYNARLAYARSVAVMSMVGYILGLGDRHGENILFDANSGEAMHVDFNCLFNKGLTLEVPEIVPFRLTHNMVDAMGPTKYEGFFRRASEVTMNVLREQREPLMSVLRTFIHDPLVEWSKKSRSGGASSLDENSGEVVNEKALSHMNDIDKRLRGIVAKSKGLPLSIEGHVHFLIQEATDQEKLCQMYIGWAPFM